MNRNTFDRVDRDDRPDANAENVPDEIVEKALSFCARYGECPHCGERQFYPAFDTHNTEWDCRECGETIKVIG